MIHTLKVFFIISLSFFLHGCIVITTSNAVPHATYKIELPSNEKKDKVLNKINTAMLSEGFVIEENDWEAWARILSDEELKDKKLERTYKHGDIKLSYSPDNFNHIRLNFYEYNQKQFTPNAIGFYYNIKESISNMGLIHLSQTEDDLKSYRPLFSPEDFNNKHPLPTYLETAKEIFIALIGVGIYIAIIVFPFWYWLRKLFNKYDLTVNIKRFLFSLACLIVIFPFPIPISMFGPMLLIPGIFNIPFIYNLPEGYIMVILISSITTGVLSAVASLWFLKKPLTNQ